MAIDRRILIADDDAAFRQGVAELLFNWGLEVEEAPDGAAALELLRLRPPSLALLDMHMPGFTGLEILTTLRRETLSVPCIFWSANASEVIERLARREGALAVLRKPVPAAELRRHLNEALNL
ncbi:MAG: two-component system response regulator [Planctomycetes bacterium]|jgi:CheY-like chemotaxis protein|nr:two-component system response regulator [Planctomycetota bacterium]HJO26813.1 response regulator [Planctomycetota bacterium]